MKDSDIAIVIDNCVRAISRMFDERILSIINPVYQFNFINPTTTSCYTNPFLLILNVEDVYGENYTSDFISDDILLAIPKSLIQKITISHNFNEMLNAIYDKYSESADLFPFTINIAFTFFLSILIEYNKKINYDNSDKYFKHGYEYEKLRNDHLKILCRMIIIEIYENRDVDELYIDQLYREMINTINDKITCLLYYATDDEYSIWNDGFLSCESYFDNKV